MSLKGNYVWLYLFVIVFLTSCPADRVLDKKVSSIAVWDLENLTPSSIGGPDIGEVLSAKVVQIIRETKDYDVVERQRLYLALEELGLGTTALIDDSTRLRLGRLVGARLMLFGTYQLIEDSMRLDVRLVDVETGSILKAAQKTTQGGDLSSWLEAAEEVAREVFQADIM